MDKNQAQMMLNYMQRIMVALEQIAATLKAK